MGSGSVLIVEDDVLLAKMLIEFLRKNGFEADGAADAATMFNCLENRSYDHLVIDLTLPDEDGIVLVRKMRARSQVPIIVLTGRNQIEDKMACFELGADDYIVKPVDPRELVMRLQAVSRRADGEEGAIERIRFGPLTLDKSRRLATRDDGEAISLTPAEFSMIWVLATSQGKVLTREDLVDAVSTGEGPLSFRAVDILISRLRKKLDKAAIETVPTVGYKCGWEVDKA